VKYQQSDILKKMFFCLILLFLGFMSTTVTHAETYTFVTKWGSHGSSDGQFIAPIGIDVDSLDNVYVADFGNHRIQKFDSNGNFMEMELWRWNLFNI
jgi:tripartite motif-containing protein 71